MLGELGRYPLHIIKSLVQTGKYKWSLLNSNHGCNTLVSEALSEVDNLGIDNWLYCAQQLEKLFNLSINPSLKSADSVGKYVNQKLQSQFDLYWKMKYPVKSVMKMALITISSVFTQHSKAHLLVNLTLIMQYPEIKDVGFPTFSPPLVGLESNLEDIKIFH